MHKQTLAEVLTRAAAQCGFLSMADVATIAESDRLRQLLVRCGSGRFTCPAQDVAHFYKCVTAGGDYVRDVSLPVSDPAMKKPERATQLVILEPATPTSKAQIGERYVEPAQPRCECGKPSTVHHVCTFREEDYGGVFDGHNVTSDADPGL